MNAVYAASYNAFGTGCRGSAGVPTLGPAPGQLPWAGEPMTSQVVGVPAGGLVWALLGSSRTQWGAIPLPLSLAILGLPTCSLYTDPLVTVPATVVGSTATWTLPIPTSTTLLGAPYYEE